VKRAIKINWENWDVLGKFVTLPRKKETWMSTSWAACVATGKWRSLGKNPNPRITFDLSCSSDRWRFGLAGTALASYPTKVLHWMVVNQERCIKWAAHAHYFFRWRVLAVFYRNSQNPVYLLPGNKCKTSSHFAPKAIRLRAGIQWMDHKSGEANLGAASCIHRVNCGRLLRVETRLNAKLR